MLNTADMDQRFSIQPVTAPLSMPSLKEMGGERAKAIGKGQKDGEQTELGLHEGENEKGGEYEPMKGTSKMT